MLFVIGLGKLMRTALGWKETGAAFYTLEMHTIKVDLLKYGFLNFKHQRAVGYLANTFTFC